jgi:hypothetical protein
LPINIAPSSNDLLHSTWLQQRTDNPRQFFFILVLCRLCLYLIADGLSLQIARQNLQGFVLVYFGVTWWMWVKEKTRITVLEVFQVGAVSVAVALAYLVTQNPL